MDDLISRSALLKKFNDRGIQITFDLPVEEVLGENVDIDDFAMLVQDAIQAYKNMVIETIKAMSTAYDIEKVVDDVRQDCYSMGFDESQTEIVVADIRKGGVE